MEFTIDAFTTRLRDLMYERFPRLPGRGFNPSGSPKHGGEFTPPFNDEIRDVAFKNNPTYTLDMDTMAFEIGNDYAEEHYPYYHILEDAPYIRKRNRATDKTKGSQAKVEELSKRDYNVIGFNGKIYTKEYSRNVRGARSRLSSVSHWATDYNGNKVMINRDSNSYLNVHYQYIEKMMNTSILDQLAMEFGLKKPITQVTSLKEDYEALSIVDIINSLAEE